MATTEYITLTTSGSEIEKKFYAILNGYTEVHEKNQTIEINISGNPLITNGGIFKRFSYVLKLSAEMEESGYGTKDDLKQIYLLNNPNGSPSDVIYLTDHYGVVHAVKFEGKLELTPLTTTIEGTDSYFYTPIKFIEAVDE